MLSEMLHIRYILSCRTIHGSSTNIVPKIITNPQRQVFFHAPRRIPTSRGIKTRYSGRVKIVRVRVRLLNPINSPVKKNSHRERLSKARKAAYTEATKKRRPNGSVPACDVCMSCDGSTEKKSAVPNPQKRLRARAPQRYISPAVTAAVAIFKTTTAAREKPVQV